MADNKIQELISFYQQVYFTFDKPVPLTNKLLVYPVLVKDYYLYYSLINVLRLEKNEDMTGIGISMTNLEYLVHKISEQTPEGEQLTSQVIKLFELIFKVNNGIKCECDCNGDTFKTYSDLLKEVNELEEEISTNEQKLSEQQILDKINNLKICPKCGKIREDVIRFNKMDDGKLDFIVDGEEITPEIFDYLRKIVLYQNDPNYKDEYINPELKKELELAAQLENPSNKTPTLEKQMLCIVASTPYELEELQEMTMRHFTMLLRIVDAKIHYQVMKSAEMSGFVQFKGEIEHWIYSSDKPQSMLEKAMSLSGLKSKMAPVTGGAE